MSASTDHVSKGLTLAFEVSSNHKLEMLSTLENGVDSEKTNQAGTAEVFDKETAWPTPSPAPAAASPPPDGGCEAWLAVLGGWCAFLVSFGWLNSVGVFQEYYQQVPLRDYSPSAVSWIPSTKICFLFVCGPVVGKLFDSFGPRYILLVGSLLHVFGLMMCSLGSKYYQFFMAQSVCSAIGYGAIFYSSMNAVSTWFMKKRATAIGIVASGSSLGGVFLPIMVTKSIPQIGFGWTMRAIAFLILGLLIVANLTIKSRLTHTKKPVHMMEFILPLREPPFILLASVSFFFYFGVFLPFNFLILQGQALGMSHDLSNYLVPIMNAASLFGRVLPGFLADRFGRYNTMIVTTFVSAILALALWIPAAGSAAIIVFAGFYGFFSGAFVSLGPALVAQISDIRQIGVRNGTVYFLVSMSVLVGNPIGDALVTKNGTDFRGLQIWCGATLLVGSVFFVASRIARTGLKLNVF